MAVGQKDDLVSERTWVAEKRRLSGLGEGQSWFEASGAVFSGLPMWQSWFAASGAVFCGPPVGLSWFTASGAVLVGSIL
ncbi:hypothetical protein NDU88_002387 [Pleurodeles waltl]|uniref:Uncharacterized protein n=1 Tax=Pleurodeles waltl TaxID=8319 RepID=A0AAV7TL31_PLEWA|nr:hypothetical protein NDU88_002387 [Pleurodeles waltl]